MVSGQNVLVSIVTVCYNSEETIRDTLDSVLQQTYTNIEYLIVDGSSCDGTLQIIEEFRPAFEQRGIRYIVSSEPDNGIYDAMNKGTQKATGELVGILNSDDWYEPNAIERVVDTYQKTDFDMFYADLRLVKPDRILIKHSRYRKFATSRDWNHPTTFLKRKIYDRFQYECRTIHDDWDLVLKIRNAGYKIVVLNEVLANFRVGGESNNGGIQKAIVRCRQRYGIYRRNGMSRLYLIECVAIETAKMILRG
jgi:glycosyltransferase involved in cell wall biosynthesis